jgi:3D-(3,5/4)-trihydroxycyclohexane-1,2-dione acylhydrolase (decyclizing)
MLGQKLTVVLLDNRGFGCINRLQHATGGERFNNLFDYNTAHNVPHDIDFAAHARSLGAIAEKVDSIADLETALKKAKQNDRSTVIVIDTDPMISTEAGGHWWDVAVPEVSERKEVLAARKTYEDALRLQRAGD